MGIFTSSKAYSGTDPYVFVSYAHSERDLVELFVIDPLQKYYNVWFDRGLSYGKKWNEELEKKLEGCAFILFVASQASLESECCKKEILSAREKNKKILVVEFDTDLELPDELTKEKEKIYRIKRQIPFSTARRFIGDCQKCPLFNEVRKTSPASAHSGVSASFSVISVILAALYIFGSAAVTRFAAPEIHNWFTRVLAMSLPMFLYTRAAVPVGKYFHKRNSSFNVCVMTAAFFISVIVDIFVSVGGSFFSRIVFGLLYKIVPGILLLTGIGMAVRMLRESEMAVAVSYSGSYRGSLPFAFFSYAPEDKETVNSFLSSLKKGYNVCYSEEPDSGDDVWEMIDGCRAFFFALTENSVRSGRLLRLLDYARSLGKPFIIVNFSYSAGSAIPTEFRERYGNYHFCDIPILLGPDDAVRKLEEDCEWMSEIRMDHEERRRIEDEAFVSLWGEPQSRIKEEPFFLFAVGPTLPAREGAVTEELKWRRRRRSVWRASILYVIISALTVGYWLPFFEERAIRADLISIVAFIFATRWLIAALKTRSADCRGFLLQLMAGAFLVSTVINFTMIEGLSFGERLVEDLVYAAYSAFIFIAFALLATAIQHIRWFKTQSGTGVNPGGF